MPRWQRAVLVTISVLLGLVAVGAIAVFVLTSTDWGRERVRRVAERQLQNRAHGLVRIGRISGNLLTGMRVHDLVITDSAGKPFVAVKSIRGDYRVLDFFRKRIWIRNAIVENPVVVLDKAPDGPWNWKAIFPSDTAPERPGQPQGWGDWLRFTNARIIEGTLVMRTPWNPSRRLTPPARDSAIAEALSGNSRQVVERVPGGFQKIVELRSLTATLPLLRLADPRYDHRLAQVASLEMEALPFREPSAVVRQLRGEFPFNDDSVWWDDVTARLTQSVFSGSGSFSFDTGDLVLAVRGAPAVFADLRWVYPRLPANGRGTLDFRLTWRGAVEDYLAYNMDMSVGEASVRGSFGMTRGDSVLFHTTNLQFSRVDTRLIEQVIPAFDAPRRGVLSGVAKIQGGRNALAVDGDVTFVDQATGASRVVARGEVGFPGDGLRARNLRLQLRPLQMDLVRAYAPDIPFSGTLTGNTVVNGFTGSGLQVAGDIEHRERGELSRISGRANVTLAGTKRFDLDVRLAPLSMTTVARAFPEVKIGGTLSGPLAVRGTLDNFVANGTLEHREAGELSRIAGRGSFNLAGTPRFDIDARVAPLSLVAVSRYLPDAELHGSVTGPIALRGTFDQFNVRTDLAIAGGGRVTGGGDITLAKNGHYDVTATLQRVNVSAVLRDGPVTSLSGRVMARGTGLDPETARATVAADLSASSWESLAITSGVVRADVGGGLLTLARLDVRGDDVVAEASGSFGLTRGRRGTLAYRVAIDSLGALNRWIPGLLDDTTVVRPRPANVARAVRIAREDSARVARATEIERIVTGKPAPRLVVAAPREVRRDAASGSLYAAGTLAGNIHDFDLRGRAGGEDVALRGSFVRRFRADYAWANAPSRTGQLAFGLQADSVLAMGFAFDSVDARVAYRDNAGHADILIRQGETQDYGVSGDFQLAQSRNEARVTDFRIRLDTALWRGTRPTIVRWGGPGIEVVNFEVRDRGEGRIYANGLLPTEGVSNFEIAIDNLPVEHIATLMQSDFPMTGTLDIAGTMRGTLRAPTFRGAFALVEGVYDENVLPIVRGTFGYADRELVSHVDLLRGTGAPMAVADARLPIDLALSGVTGDRLLDAPMSVDVTADSLPLELIPYFTDAVSNVHGHVAGKVAMRGRLDRPAITGGLVIANGVVTLNQTGATLEQLRGEVVMRNDSIVVESITAKSHGDILVRGAVAIGNWREPSFDLYLVATDATVMDGDYGKIRANLGLALKGTLDAPYLSGSATILQGVIRAPEPTGKRLIGSDDPALFNVLDTAVVAERDLFPARSAILRNMRMEVQLDIERSTWVRTRDANLEVFTDYPLSVRVQNEAVAITGVVSTDRGEYTFLSKRFEIRRGSALFVGTPEINPTLQITGEYEVQLPAQPTMQVKVLIGGTLKRPSLALESDAQPPRSQSELLSLLAFGRASTSLLSIEGSSITAAPTGADLFGIGAQLAVRRLGGVAMGVAVDELESEVGRAIGTDFLNITPADVPTELVAGRGLKNVIAQTRVEAGKYLNPRTFLGVQTTGFYPGARLEYRTPSGWRYELSTEPRTLLREPTLSKQFFSTQQAYGAFIIREWRF